MKNTELTKIRSSLARIETTKVKLGKVRDELRDQVSDLEDILESISDALDYLEDGKKQ